MFRCQRKCHRFKSDILLQQGDNMTDKVEPISFKEQWEAKKLLKRTKKKAKKELLQRGHSPKEATGMIKQALKTIQSNKPERKSAGRGR